MSMSILKLFFYCFAHSTIYMYCDMIRWKKRPPEKKWTKRKTKKQNSISNFEVLLDFYLKQQIINENKFRVNNFFSFFFCSVCSF